MKNNKDQIIFNELVKKIDDDFRKLFDLHQKNMNEFNLKIVNLFISLNEQNFKADSIKIKFELIN